jgi:thiamine-monophosphate kinase
LNEFELIEKYFSAGGARRSDVAVGIGDDAAVLNPPAGQQLVLTTDVLVAGVHFPAGTDPEAIGYKALAVNLSDLAAMGAEPAWATLGLTLPEANEAWLDGFSRGFLALAGREGVQLVGGDTTRGPLSIGVTLAGFVPPGKALFRSGAREGDDIFVTGEIGDAVLALAALKGRASLTEAMLASVRRKLDWPQPRVREGIALRGLASAAIDISDGLLADLGHIATRSGVKAVIESRAVPLSPALQSVLGREFSLEEALAGGDDYELCFTAAPARREEIEQTLRQVGTRLTRIGTVVAGQGVNCLGPDGRPLSSFNAGYRHFE